MRSWELMPQQERVIINGTTHIEVVTNFDNMYLSFHIATNDVVVRSSLELFE